MEWAQISDKNEKVKGTEHIYRDKTDKTILKKAPWKDYRLHITVLFLVIISEFIGPVEFNLTKDICVVIMPLLYAMVIGLALFLLKPVKWITKKQSKIAESAMLLFIGPLLAKLAVASGQSFHILLDVGPALVLQEFGNLGTVFLALPVALLLGFKKETIGMTNSIGRETNVAVVIDKFGFEGSFNSIYYWNCYWNVIHQFSVMFMCISFTTSSICICNGNRGRQCKYECSRISSIVKCFPGKYEYKYSGICRIQ